MAGVRERWSALRRWERTVLVLALSCLGGVFAVDPLVLWASPELAVMATAWDEEEDPWGTPYLRTPAVEGRHWTSVFSAGPNRRDEAGEGDDIVLRTVALRRMVTYRGRRYFPAWFPLLGRAEAVLAGLSLLFAWVVLMPFRRSPRGRAWIEALRAAAIAVPPTLFLCVGLDTWMRAQHYQLDAHLRDLPQQAVSMRVAAIGTLAVVCYAAAFVWRLRSALPEAVDHPPAETESS